jgi:hypothetical protein
MKKDASKVHSSRHSRPPRGSKADLGAFGDCQVGGEMKIL